MTKCGFTGVRCDPKPFILEIIGLPLDIAVLLLMIPLCVSMFTAIEMRLMYVKSASADANVSDQI